MSPRSAKSVPAAQERFPMPMLCFMHPVKAEEAIAEAYFDHGVRTFSLDTAEELDKIVRATTSRVSLRADLNLLVRIRVSSDHTKAQPCLEIRVDVTHGTVSALLMAARRQAADALEHLFSALKTRQ